LGAAAVFLEGLAAAAFAACTWRRLAIISSVNGVVVVVVVVYVLQGENRAVIAGKETERIERLQRQKGSHFLTQRHCQIGRRRSR
jgi:hypothetical protein